MLAGSGWRREASSCESFSEVKVAKIANIANDFVISSG
jgi:hypothetical protein